MSCYFVRITHNGMCIALGFNKQIHVDMILIICYPMALDLWKVWWINLDKGLWQIIIFFISQIIYFFTKFSDLIFSPALIYMWSKCVVCFLYSFSNNLVCISWMNVEKVFKKLQHLGSLEGRGCRGVVFREITAIMKIALFSYIQR